MVRWLKMMALAGALLAQDPVAVDPRHYTVELANSRVRVLRVHYLPGEGSAMHEHTAGVRIFLTDIRNKFTMPDGSTSEASRRAGDIIWAEPVRHGNVNIGANPVEIIEMEIAGLPKRPATAAPAASDGVVLQNEFVRVLRMTIGPHGKSAARAHPNRVVVAMKGQVRWEAAGSGAIENTGDGSVEYVVVELL